MMISIDVDMEVYKALSALRPSDDAPHNAALRNLLGLAEGQAAIAQAPRAKPKAGPPSSGGQAKPRHAPAKRSGPAPKIAVLGATGSIGGKIVDEALSRGIEVVAVARDPSKVTPKAGVSVKVANANDPQALAAALTGTDAVLVAVRWADADVNKLLEGVRASGVKRSMFVVGCGTLLRDDGRRHFKHAAEANGVPPPPTVPAMRVLETLKSSDDLDWTAISCAMDIGPGERTGHFRVGGEDMVLDAEGESRISTQDFAIAVLDEIEEPHFVRRQFGVGY